MAIAKEKTAKDIMTSPLITVSPNDRLGDVERLLLESNVNGVPVVEGDALVGVLSRSDFARIPLLLNSLDGYVHDFLEESALDAEQVQSFSKDLEDMLVSDAMTTQVSTCELETPIPAMAHSMIVQHVHRLVVVDNNQPVGLVSSLDLVALLAD